MCGDQGEIHAIQRSDPSFVLLKQQETEVKVVPETVPETENKPKKGLFRAVIEALKKESQFRKWQFTP